MATAIKNEIPVVTKVEVVLTLSKEEAETLLAVDGTGGGGSLRSRRKHSQAIYNALLPLGLQYDALGEYELGNEVSGLRFRSEGCDLHRHRPRFERSGRILSEIDTLAAVFDTPTVFVKGKTTKRKYLIAAMALLLKPYADRQDVLAILENVHSMPSQGVSSSFCFGE